MSTSWQKKHLGDIAKISSGKMILRKRYLTHIRKAYIHVMEGMGLEDMLRIIFTMDSILLLAE